MAEAFSIEFETRRFEAFSRELTRGLERKHVRRGLLKLAFDLLSLIIRKMPVDTGRARAGWTPFLIRHGQPVPAGPDAQAVQEGREKGFFEERFTGDEQLITLGNAVDYIIPLEYGHSQQAPAGFLRLSMLEIQGRKGMERSLGKSLEDAIKEADKKTRGR